MISIQRPTKDDVNGIQEVFYKTWLETYPNKEAGITIEDIEERFKDRYSPDKIKKRLARILNLSPDLLFLVAKDDGKVVGVCNLEKFETYNKLSAIYVLPDYQGQGIGKMFWEEVKEFFGEDKDIIVQVVIYNSRAIDFYQKLGFIDTGKRFTEETLRMPISGKMFQEMEMIIKAKNI